MKRFCIDGVFTQRKISGTTRYCWELLDKLDTLIPEYDVYVELLLPKDQKIEKEYKNIKIVNYGKNVKFLWLNVFYQWYLFKNKMTGLNMSVNVPILNPGVVCVFDVNAIANPDLFSRYHRMKTKTEKKIAAHRAKKIFTISEFCAGEIYKYLGYPEDKIGIVPCAWQHLDRVVTEGDSEQLIGLSPKSYFFSLSSIAPTKNFKWVIEAARQNPDYTFVIAGGTSPKTFGLQSFNDADSNVKYMGRVSDEDAKVLMRDCKAFLFPSVYEGFGIPPMEAMACGAEKVVISDIPVMREVYESSACYIDPYNLADIDMQKILSQQTTSCNEVLNKYSWNNSARKLLEFITR